MYGDKKQKDQRLSYKKAEEMSFYIGKLGKLVDHIGTIDDFDHYYKSQLYTES